MKIRVVVDVGLCGCRREETVEIPDGALDGLGDQEMEAEIEDIAREAMFNMIDWDYEVIED